jgi:hypothetical protein
LKGLQTCVNKLRGPAATLEDRIGGIRTVQAEQGTGDAGSRGLIVWTMYGRAFKTMRQQA